MYETRTFRSREEMDRIHRDESSAFPIVWAFSKADLIEGAQKVWNIDLESMERPPKLIAIGGGGYILKEHRDAYLEMLKQHSEERKLMASSFKELVATIRSAMFNREYSYTLDRDDVMEELMSYKDLPRFEEAWKKAEKAVLKGTA